MKRREFLAMPVMAALDGKKGAHHVYDFRGMPFEVGLQHGKALRQEIRAEAQPAAEALARSSGVSVEAVVSGVLSRYEGRFREQMPSVLEEIRGISEGAKLPYSYAFFAATRDMMRTHACTAVVCGRARTSDGRVLIGQTKDTSSPLDRFRIMRIAYTGGRSMVVLNYPGWAANLCLTSDGLSFTGNSLYGKGPSGKTVPGSFLKRLIMEKKSTSEVLDAIRGLSFENGCLLIADRSGHAVCLELMAGRVEARDVSGQAFGHANEILFELLLPYRGNTKGSASSPLRQKRIDELLRRIDKNITVEALQAMFRDHEGVPLSICRHPSAEDESVTNASFVADLTKLQMHISIGNPCEAPYTTYELPKQA